MRSLRKAPTPKAETIYRGVLSRIKAGKWPIGTTLPSAARIADIYNSSQRTVEDAFEILKREGWITQDSWTGSPVVIRDGSLPTGRVTEALVTYKCHCCEGTFRVAYTLPLPSDGIPEHASHACPRKPRRAVGLP